MWGRMVDVRSSPIFIRYLSKGLLLHLIINPRQDWVFSYLVSIFLGTNLAGSGNIKEALNNFSKLGKLQRRQCENLICWSLQNETSNAYLRFVSKIFIPNLSEILKPTTQILKTSLGWVMSNTWAHNPYEQYLGS